MKTIKKMGVIILTYLIVLSGLVVNVSANEENEFEYYNDLSGNSIYITGYHGTDPNVVIPESIDGKTVVGLNLYIYYQINNLDSLTIPKTVTKIDSLGAISIDDIIVEEGNSSFVVKDGVLYTSDYKTLVRCTKSVETLNLSDNLETVEGSAFYNCSNLKSINISKNIDNLYESFYDGEEEDWCITEGYVFEGCANLENITVDPDNQNYIVENGALYTKDHSLLIKYFDRNNKNVVINESTVCIEMEAFNGCTNLETVDLKNATDLMDLVFANCTNLKSVNYPKVENLHNGGTFYNCTSLESIKLPDACRFIGTYIMTIFFNCTNLKKLDLNNLEDYFDRDLFYNCPKLTELVIPETVESVSLRYIYDDLDITYYVYEGSQAEKDIIAINEEVEAGGFGDHLPVKYKLIKKLRDDKLDITVDLQTNDILDAVLQVKQINEGSNFDKVINELSNFSMYDISLVKNNQKVEVNENCLVKIPVPENMEGNNCKVYYLSDDIKYTDMNAVYEEGYMVFTTDHFSKYIITDETVKEYTLGDINGDGLIDYNDAVLALQSDSGLIALEGNQKIAADVNKDNLINYNDAVQILKYDAGLITEF